MTGGYSSTEDELLTDTSDDDSESEQEFRRRSTWKRLRRRVRTPVSETSLRGPGLSVASPRASQGYSSTDGGTTDDTGSDSETDEVEEHRRMVRPRPLLRCILLRCTF